MEVQILGFSAGSEMLRIVIGWSDPDTGFGQIEIMQYLDEEYGSVVIDSELMDRPFIKDVLNALVDKARVRGEPLDKEEDV